MCPASRAAAAIAAVAAWSCRIPRACRGSLRQAPVSDHRLDGLAHGEAGHRPDRHQLVSDAGERLEGAWAKLRDEGRRRAQLITNATAARQLIRDKLGLVAPALLESAC